ncbi:MAG: hypothetical protein AAFU79_02695 [Myxococcota bacterium]
MKAASDLRPRTAPWALLPLLAACGESPDEGSTPIDLGVLMDAGTMAQPDAAILDGGFEDAGVSGDDMGVNALCPPQAPFGTGLGATMAEIQLPDCDGQLQSLHAACDKKASYFFVYADW